MPPIHPAVVHFPIALMVFAFVSDLMGYLRNSPMWRRAGLRSLVGAAIGAALAIAAGYYDMGRSTLGETHEYVHVHMSVGWILFCSMTGLGLWRWLLSRKSEFRISPVYLSAACLTLVITLFQGWYGGELVYSQGAGVAAAGKGTEPPSAGYQRLTSVTKRLAGKTEEHEHRKEESGEAHK